MVLFVALFYCPGMPILLPVALVYCVVNYWLDKYAFLRVYKIPAKLDSSYHAFALEKFGWAVIVHLIMSVFFYTSPVNRSYAVGEAMCRSMHLRLCECARICTCVNVNVCVRDCVRW